MSDLPSLKMRILRDALVFNQQSTLRINITHTNTYFSSFQNKYSLLLFSETMLGQLIGPLL